MEKLAPRSAREPQGRGHVGSGTLYTSLSPMGTYRCSPITGREEIRPPFPTSLATGVFVCAAV